MFKISRTAITPFYWIFFVALGLPVSLRAMEFRQFDNMNTLNQAEFIAVMVDATQKALSDAGEAKYAAQIEQLFTAIEPGDSVPVGLAELERNVDRARVADAKRSENDPNARRLDVEDALFVTLKKNNIPMTPPVVTAVMNALANFHSLTNAEFEAKSTSEQRRYIALLAKTAYPDAMYRQNVQDLQKGQHLTPDTPETRKRALDIVARQFPNASTDQPGFAEVARDIRSEYAKAPNAAGPMYVVTIHLLDLQKADVANEMKRMEDETYHLPPR